MTGKIIREKFLAFFASKGHRIVPSDSLVPKDDPTVLFTTAGMQQFKPQFMGHISDFTKAASSQKCLRTDDLEEVGKTDFHHTLFEMLGNFSFGDYFKKEAITWAWEFLTKELQIPQEKLWVSVHQEDDEAYQTWLQDIKLSKNKIVKLGDRSNFWPSNARLQGPNGPCGPCSEIFYDWGKNEQCSNPDCNPDCDCGRFCEIWNLVFTQYNRKDGGVLEPLPSKNIDTGMGLERLTAVMQNKRNNFDSDLFQLLIQAIENILQQEKVTLSLKEKRVIADHIRAVTFGLADGVVPSNESRGYVMRRLIVDMSNMMIQAGVKKPIIHQLVADVVAVMKDPYEDLVKKEKEIQQMIYRVEESVLKLHQEKIPEFLSQLKNTPKDSQALGALMFYYRDTCGLPMNLIMAQVKNQCDENTSQSALLCCQSMMDEQKQRSRENSKMKGDVFLNEAVDVKSFEKTKFLGYETMTSTAQVLGLFVNHQKVSVAQDKQAVVVILDQTPFYPEQGGQIFDQGLIQSSQGLIRVHETHKKSDVILHYGVVEGEVKEKDSVTAFVNEKRRLAVMSHHTATHLLQGALRLTLGSSVKQQGSFVDENRLRFDFTHSKGLTPQEMIKIENQVNEWIRQCLKVEKQAMSLKQAQESGALAFFAEKYEQTVRIVSIGDVSKEFCGGTHLDNIGQMGLFKIVSETAVAQGIRRIEAVCAQVAFEYFSHQESLLEKASALMKVPREELSAKIQAQNKTLKDLQKQISSLRLENFRSQLNDQMKHFEKINGTFFVAEMMDGADRDILRQLADFLKQKLSSSLICLATVNSEEGILLISLSDDGVQKGLSASKMIKDVSLLFDGSGGGRADMAQAGCKDSEKLKKAFDQIVKELKESLLK